MSDDYYFVVRTSDDYYFVVRTSDDNDVLCFVALATGSNVELNALTFLQGSVTLGLDVGEVNEDITSTFTRDEAIALLSVEKLDGTAHLLSLFSN